MTEDVTKTTEDVEDENELVIDSNGNVVVQKRFNSLASQMQENVTVLNGTLAEPFIRLKDSLNVINTSIEEAVAPVVDMRSTVIENVAEPLQAVATQYKESAALLSDLAQSTKVDLASFENIITDFPIKGASIVIDPMTTVDVGIEGATLEEVDTVPTGIALSSVAYHRTSIGVLEFETERSLVVKVDRLESKVDIVQNLLANEIYPFLLEDSQRKDNVLNEILAYYKGKPNTFVKVTGIKFSKRACKLTIDKQDIPLKPDTNEEELCRIIFKNKEALEKLWSIDEIVEAMGESIEQTRRWNPKMYQAARQLNNKIARETGFRDFIVYTTKTICINPIFLED